MFLGNGARQRSKILKGVLTQNRQILGLEPVSRKYRLRWGVVAGSVGIVMTGMFILTNSSSPSRHATPTRIGAAIGAKAPASGAPGAELGPLSGPAPVPAPRRPATSDAAEYLGLAMARSVPVRNMLGLGVKTIMIDAGHGGTADGAIGPAGALEKDITLDIALKLRARLARNTGYTILVTRETDVDCSLRQRVERANTRKADLFVSIHVNSVRPRSMDIVETYFFGPTTDKSALKLAAEENEGSDYAISDYEAVIQKIANKLKFEESSRLAGAVHQTLFHGLSAQNGAMRDWGVKRAPFVILLGVDMPAILVEAACLSNPDEEKQLRDPAYRERIAEFIEKGINQYLNQRSGS